MLQRELLESFPIREPEAGLFDVGPKGDAGGFRSTCSPAL